MAPSARPFPALILWFCLFVTGCSGGLHSNCRFTRAATVGSAVKFRGKQPSIRYRRPDFLSYDELVSLSRNPHPDPPLQRKLEKLWRSPVISNEAWFAGKRPHQQSTARLGPILRVASWNIEKSLAIRETAAALSSSPAYLGMIDPEKAPPGSATRQTMLRQRERLAAADIIFLQEMDIGVSRSHYVDAARTLAQALGMNYAYAPQSLEVDPVLLGLEPRPDIPRIQPHSYKGVFGSAILSRYPILKVETFQLKTQPYDWYAGEKKAADPVEKTRRFGSAVVFENTITRELKVGGRNYFRVDIAVPQVPGGVVTLINDHLEIKTRPQHRKEQVEEILGYIRSIPHPVIMAGDFNSAPDDLSPTSAARVLWRQVDSPESLLNTSFLLADLAFNTVVPLYREGRIVNFLKNFQNPLAPDVPLLFPNQARGLFQSIEDYRFDDGTAFDFRGDPAHSINGRGGILANSNEKRFFGHTTTFGVKRPIGPIGRYRLDWFFVRSKYLRDPLQKHGSYRFAPHFGETLREFSDNLKSRLSDHRPIVIDLPLQEPESANYSRELTSEHS